MVYDGDLVMVRESGFGVINGYPSLQLLWFHLQGCLCHKIGELIDKEEASWKVGVVDALFLPHEVETIKAIPISTNLPEDKQIWAWSTNGVFSVKNAYGVASQMSLVKSTVSSSDGSQEKSFWKKLWQINVPHKIRHFAWRACRDILPLKTNLVKKKCFAG